MSYRLIPAASMQADVQRVGIERIEDALARLEGLHDEGGAEIERAVHEVRKRCKEVRGLARLVRPALGSDFDEFNRLVRSASAELSSLRDAHAVLSTFDELRASSDGSSGNALATVRVHQAEAAQKATDSVQARDPRIERAAELLGEARSLIDQWNIPDGFDPLAAGLGRNYARGRRCLRRARRKPNDDTMHEWRKSVKNLWYQLRLLEASSPSVLDPLIERFDDLADALGDDHDLSVLVERLSSDRKRFGGKKAVRRAIRLARAQQDELRRRAFRLGWTLYAEEEAAFVERIGAYWKLTLRDGPELVTGGIAELRGEEEDDDDDAETSSVERERKFLLDAVPDLDDEGTVLRQGYLAVDQSVSVRVREAGDRSRTVTIKAGGGAVRTEVEWSIDAEQFASLWELTAGRRVDKTRYRLALDGHVAEIDVFADELEGLVIAEVEFDSDEAMGRFEPPDWFGLEVTDDLRYTNASLATDGLEFDGASPVISLL